MKRESIYRTDTPKWMFRVGYQRTIWWVALAAVAVVTGGPALVMPSALAQSWLPWTTREEPRRRPPPRRAPRAAPNYGQGQYRQPRARRSWSGNVQRYGNRSPICLQLEQRLAQDARRQANSQGTIQKLRQQLNNARRQKRRAERELDRRDCYEAFLFTRSLRPSRVCHKYDRQARVAAGRVEGLSLKLRQFEGGGRSNQDEIVRALARNNCGANYQQAARRDSFSNFWQDNDGYDSGSRNLFGGLPFATYRTVCVRLCDGYYFPVSFSTLPNHFGRDLDVCQSKCAAPTELYFHQNPGGSVQGMISHRSQQPYKALRTAFRYRKEFVSGCSCKAAEYVPQDGSVVTGGAPAPQANAADPKKPKDQLSPVR